MKINYHNNKIQESFTKTKFTGKISGFRKCIYKIPVIVELQTAYVS